MKAVNGVDAYLASVSNQASRNALDRLRRIILDEALEAEEVIKYGIPTYKLNGFIASIAAFKNHCSFFPGHTVADFKKQLSGFKLAKGSVQFSPENPIPEELVRAMIRARVDENVASLNARA